MGTHPRMPPRKQSPCHALSSPLPIFPGGAFLCLDEPGCEGGSSGGKGAGEKGGLVGLIQLMKDLCSRSSCLPLSCCRFQRASFCHSMREQEERRGGTEWKRSRMRRGRGEKYLDVHRTKLVWARSCFCYLDLWWVCFWDLGLIINLQIAQTSIAVHTRTKKRALLWKEEGGQRGRRLGKEGREHWTALWMDRVFNPPSPNTLNSLSQAALLYVEWEALAESSWIPESLRHVVWLAEQNPHSGEEQTCPPPTHPRLEFSTSEERRGGGWLAMLVKESSDCGFYHVKTVPLSHFFVALTLD